GVVCFEDNGAFLPNRPDAIFNGWEITSPWQGSPLWTDAMAQELAAAEVRVEGGKHYITLLSKCPVIVTALWSNPLSEHSLHTDEIDDFRYLLHSPLNEEGNKALIVYLHDEGAKGDDLSLLTAADGLPKYLNNGDLFDLDAYVLIPQLPADKNGWADVRGSLYALIDAVCEAYPDINPECISLTGDGMGGTGTWEIALADPNRFAAIAPLSGSVDATDENAKALKWMNVFAVVGENDAVVSPDSSREFIEKLRETQGYSAEARFTVLEGAGHADVPGAYLDEELGLLQWLCMQWRAPNLAFGKCGARGGNLTWDIDYMGTLTIRGTGEMAGYQYGTPPWDMYSDEIENLVIEEGVTTLGDYAFRYCEKLTNVTLPSTLTDLAWRAFFQCSSLAEISIPSGVTRIGDGVFEGCKALTAISVDAENAAYKSVDGVLFTKDGTRLMQYPASRSGAVYAVPDGVQIIDSCAFINCAELTELSLPSSVSDVAVVAIAGCEVLAAINVDAGNAVYKSVDGVLFTEDGKTLLAYPAGKSDLAYTVPDGVTELGDGSFIGCENLERIALPASVETIAAEAFTSCRGLWSVTGGAGVKEIGNAAFGACVNLQEFALPSGLETLGELAFLGCARLTSVTIPSGLTSVSRGAFYGCKALTSVTLPASVTTIARSAFSDCTAISDVYFGGTREQWNAIAFDRGNETLRSATLHLATDELRFAITAASLTLTDSIAINYKVPAALFTDGGEYSEPYMVFTLNGEDFRVDDYRVSDANYIFTFRNIAPHKMNDVVTATLYARRGAQLCASRAVEYSVVQYCRNMLARYSTYEYYEFRTLLVDLLLYGAKAQAYMNYRMDAPADGALTPEQLAWATGGMPPLTTVQDVAAEKVADGDRRATWSAVTLYLQDSVAIRLRLTNVSGAEDLSVRVTGTNDEWTIPASEWTAADGAYYVTFSALNPAQMRESLDFTVCAGETPVSDTLRYSVESYAYAQKDKNDPRLNDLLTAMLRYGDAAREYAG
ncbi:MAG: leucine-rich repeat protein, partial [Oscillibacter sp.]|nr:leucine-rich repeat protein [Oscillibacter sp.]